MSLNQHANEDVCGYVGKHNVVMILLHLMVFLTLLFILFILFVKTAGVN